MTNTKIKINNIAEYIRLRKQLPAYKKLKERREQMVVDYYNNEIKKIISIEDNPDIESVPEEFRTICVSDFYIKKSNYISKRINEIGLSIGIRSGLELGMLPIGKKDANIISDVYLPKEQEVSSNYCEISGFGNIASLRDIRKRLGMDLKAWSHSHGPMRTFHSGTDDNTIKQYTANFGKAKRINLLEGSGKELYVDIKYFPSIVFNALESKPYSVVCMEYQQFGAKGKAYVQNVATIKQIEDTDNNKIEKEEIENQLLERVSLINGGNLKDLYEKKQCEFKQDEEKELKSFTEDDNLAKRVHKLENKYRRIAEDFTALESRYTELETKYTSLESRTLRAIGRIGRLYNEIKKKYFSILK